MIVEALCGLWTKASPLVTPEEELCISSPAFLQLQTEMAVRVAGRHYREQQKKYAGHLSPFLSVVTVNPFTAPVCKMSGLKDARCRLQTVNSGPVTHLPSMLCV